MDLSEKTVEKKTLYKGKIVQLDIDKVKLPDGRFANREIIKHQEGVAILAYKNSDTILMVEQYRKPIESVTLELPAGKVDLGEAPDSCGRRELEEETGYKAKKFTYLGKIVPSPGFSDEYIYIYKAEELYSGTVNYDEDEFINLHEYKVDEVKEMIKTGKIIDAKTICAFMFE